nr:TetR/AcrR family transcriptional regulator [Acetobacter garciniae]
MPVAPPTTRADPARAETSRPGAGRVNGASPVKPPAKAKASPPKPGAARASVRGAGTRPAASRTGNGHDTARQDATRHDGTGQDAPKPGLRERKQARAHDTLIAEAMRLFSAQGYDQTTVDEIAEAAEISRRTLFRLFQTKGDIVLAWTRGMTQTLTEALAACPRDMPPADAMMHAFTSLVPRIAANRRDTYAWVYLIEKTPSLQSVSLQKYATWENGLTEGLLTRIVERKNRRNAARLMARGGIAIFRTALDEWIRLKGRPALVPLLQKTYALQASLWPTPQDGEPDNAEPVTPRGRKTTAR